MESFLLCCQREFKPFSSNTESLRKLIRKVRCPKMTRTLPVASAGVGTDRGHSNHSNILVRLQYHLKTFLHVHSAADLRIWSNKYYTYAVCCSIPLVSKSPNLKIRLFHILGLLCASAIPSFWRHLQKAMGYSGA